MFFEQKDIETFNLDYFFNSAYSKSSDELKRLIPIELQRKISLHKKDPSRGLKPIEKVQILTVCLGYQFFNVFAKDEGVTPEVFSAISKAQAGKITNSEALKALDKEDVFIVGSAVLAKYFNYGSHIQCSKIHTLIQDYKVTKGMHGRGGKGKMSALRGIVEFVFAYNRRIDLILKRRNLTPSDFNFLTYIYDGEHTAADFHSNVMTGYAKGSIHLRKAVYKMVKKGLVEVRGQQKKKQYRISQNGTTTVNSIMDEVMQHI
jgi:hypothetical protein